MNQPQRAQGELKRVSFVWEEQRVYLRSDGRWVPCTVLVSCGESVRVANDLLGIDAWCSLDELRRKDEE